MDNFLTSSGRASAVHEPTHLKIFARTGDAPYGTAALFIGDTIQLRSVLVNSSGVFVTEIPAYWWTTGSLKDSDLMVRDGAPGKNADYIASAVGSGNIQAAVSDSVLIDTYNIVSNQTVTGQISSALLLVPDSISIISGNNQSGQAGTTLAQDLVVRVVNPANTPVPGANVTFAVSTGGGVILSAQPVQTDDNGEAHCTVRLGGQIGTDVHSFTATISTGNTRQVLFTATGTNGPPARLSFYRQPAVANAGSAFSSQPIIEIQDSYGNRVSSANNSVTLQVAQGSGTLSGTVTMPAVSGFATFTNVAYSISEANVKLSATSGGLTSATSDTFDVGSIIAAAQCAAEGAGWQTIDGGCKDLTSGLVWSAISSVAMTWDKAVWDSATSGSEAPEPWEVAKGITRDIETGNPLTDQSSVSYCHSLIESGLSDWRMPTGSEISAAGTHGAGTAVKDAATFIFSSSNGGYGKNTGYKLSTGSGDFSGTNYSRCVRRPPPTKLYINTQPAAATKGFGVNVPFETQPVISIRDTTNSIDASSQTPVTISAIDGTGTLRGTTTKNAVAGVVTFTDLYYDKAETIRLIASSPGLTSVTSNPITINQTYPRARCKTVSGSWIQAAGGCKDLTSGLTWNATSPNAMNWFDAVWDQAGPGNSGTQDIDDNGGTNDYGNSPGANADNSSTNYCHSLKESGQTDWRMPAYSELSGAFSRGAGSTYMNWNVPLWTSSTYSSDDSRAYRFYDVVGNNDYGPKATSNLYVTCVRRDPPSQLVFVSQPDGGANGFGAGVNFTTAPVVAIRDADGGATASTATVTLTVVGGTGHLWLNNIDYGSSISVPAVNGTATFSGLSYDKAGETIQLRATATDTWKGNVVTLASALSNPITFPAIYLPSQCSLTAAGWVSQYGGCNDLGANGLVWSHSVTTSNWYAAVWDSTVPGADPPDQYDQGKTNDYDNSPGAYPDTTAGDVCHRLILNGYKDWRMPTASEAVLAGAHQIGDNLRNWANNIWTSTTYPSNSSIAYFFWYSNSSGYGSDSSQAKTYTQKIRCVRPATP